MMSFLRRYWGRVTIILVVIAGICFFLFASRNLKSQVTNSLFSRTQYVIRPVSRAITYIQDWVSHETQFFLRQRFLNTEVVDLQKENSILRKQVGENRQQEQELARLRKLLELKQKLPHQTLASEVIASSPSNYYVTLILDKGTAEGIARNMVVVNEEGLVGRILQTATHSSKVLLIADQRSAVAVMFERSQSRAILEGIGNGNCRLVMEDPQAPIKEGDRIFTAGLGGVFPKGLYVGTISRIERDKRSGWATQIQVRPAADNYSIQDVLIIVHPVEPPVDLKPLEEK